MNSGVCSISSNRMRVLAGLGVLMLLCLAGCETEENRRQPFIDMAKEAKCADFVNRLYQIDGELVLWHREGNCADAGYGVSLYGETVNDLICRKNDSIAGWQYSCDQEYEELFQTILDNMDEPDLGLGETYEVERIHF